MELQGTLKQVALSRRTFLFLGSTIGVGVVFSQVLSPSEEKIWRAIYEAWTEGWLPKEKEPLKGIQQVLSLIREDKKGELSLALKLLSLGPICFFLTGSFSPWNDPSQVKEILKRWQLTKNETEKKIFGAFCAIINSAYYGNPKSWGEIGYPGPPGFTRQRDAQ